MVDICEKNDVLLQCILKSFRSLLSLNYFLWYFYQMCFQIMVFCSLINLYNVVEMLPVDREETVGKQYNCV